MAELCNTGMLSGFAFENFTDQLLNNMQVVLLLSVVFFIVIEIPSSSFMKFEEQAFTEVCTVSLYIYIYIYIHSLELRGGGS